MISIFDLLAPLILIILLGFVLAWKKFLGPNFLADLNALAFWIALPALLFHSTATATLPGPETIKLILALTGGAILVCLLSFAWAAFTKTPPESRGTLAQAAFRGNVAYVGLPLLATVLPAASADNESLRRALVAIATLIAFYNALAIIVLQRKKEGGWPRLARSVVTNPLLISSLLGLCFALLRIPLPASLDRAFELIGASAIPIALLCIGATLAGVPWKKSTHLAVVATILKIAVSPILTWLLCRALSLNPQDTLAAALLAACPTASASYIMASKMGGDSSLASTSIALSTLASWPALVIIITILR